ncbi:MAG: hypothetical protein J5726_02365 [Treponema sp.]|nr:hypothetical protein [Treponema sp.]
MKKIFTILIAAITLICLSSCNNGLKTKLDDEQAQVSFLLELDGKNITLKESSRNIGLDSVNEALKNFTFTVKLTNKEDSSKNITQTGDIVWLSSYLSIISLSKGRWTITITGQIPNVDSKLYGTTDFTVGGAETYFYLILKISGNAPGSIKFTMPGVADERPYVKLIPLDNYLEDASTTEGVIEFDDESDEDVYYEVPDTEGVSVYSTFVVTGIAPGVYYFTVDPLDKNDPNPENLQYTDLATVYPGLTSTGLQTDGKSKLILDLQCGNVTGLQDKTVWFDGGVAHLPGYGNNETNPDLIRPGYLFTGWYDSQEAAALGLFPAVPMEQKFVSQQVPYNDGVYKITNRTLYAGWKEVDTDGLLNQDLFFMISRGSMDKVLIKDKLLNRPGNSSSSPKLKVGKDAYTFNGSGDVYSLNYDELYYCDYSSLTEDSTSLGDIIQFGWNKESGIELYNEVQNVISLYTDKDEQSYALIYADLWLETQYYTKFYICKLSEDTTPLPYATVSFTAENQDFDVSSIQAFAVSGDTMILVYKDSTRGQIIQKYKLQAVSDGIEKSCDFEYILQKEGDDVVLFDYYTPYVVIGWTTNLFKYAALNVQDIYIDNNSVYFLLDENTYLHSSSADKDDIISTGAVVEFDLNLNFVGTYGRQTSTPNILSPDCEGNSHYVSNAYDITAFTGPKKLLAVYKRKLVIFEEGMYPYENDGQNSYKVKRWLSRVTTFDLDKKCIDYTQVTDLDILQGATIQNIGVSGFSWDD